MMKRAARAPFVIAAMLSMAYGVWLGLVRLGWNLPLRWPDQLVAHGPLMVCGFLGTLIGLERAVALGATWAYAAPAATAAGAIVLTFGPPGPAGAVLTTAGSLIVVAIFVVILRRHPSLFAFTMAAGAVAWVAGNVQWLAGSPVFHVVFYWAAFLVATIAGERLELNRVLRPSLPVRSMFVIAIGIVLAGAALTPRFPEPAVRVFGAGLIALTAWLARHDVARRTIRQRGLTRFMAASLLSGYFWLGAGGAIAALTGAASPGVRYDAVLHAIFLGFVVSMVFAHAPIIFPAVLGDSLSYRPAFYVPLAVLHLSVMLRVAGDLAETLGRWRGWGGLLSAVALLLFIVNTVRSVGSPEPSKVGAA